MRLTPGAVRLDDVLGGTLLAGTIPAPRFRRQEATAQNAGLVNVRGPLLELVSVALVGLVVGDRVLVTVNVRLSKLVAAGTMMQRLHVAVGAASLQFGVNQPTVEWLDPGFPLGAGAEVQWTALGRVVVAGDGTLRVSGQSDANGYDVGAQDAQLYAWVIPGS